MDSTEIRGARDAPPEKRKPHPTEDRSGLQSTARHPNDTETLDDAQQARDERLEQLIDDARADAVEEFGAGRREAARAAFCRLRELHGMRSATKVAAMERARGLR